MSPKVQSYSVQKQVEENFLPKFKLQMNGKQQVFAVITYMHLTREAQIPKPYLQKVFNEAVEDDLVEWLAKFVAQSLIDMGEEFLEKMR